MIMSAIVVAVIVLGGLGVVGALVLYLVSKRFYVKEDPRRGNEISPPLSVRVCGVCIQIEIQGIEHVFYGRADYG